MKTIKFVLVAVVMFLAFDKVSAQVLAPSDFPDQSWIKDNTRNRKPIPYTYQR